MKVVQKSRISQVCRNYITAAEWMDLIVNHTSTLVSGQNYNSFASQVGASVFNIASMLADMERNLFLDTDYSYSLTRPHTQGGNEEEDENFFFSMSVLLNREILFHGNSMQTNTVLLFVNCSTQCMKALDVQGQQNPVDPTSF